MDSRTTMVNPLSIKDSGEPLSTLVGTRAFNFQGTDSEGLAFALEGKIDPSEATPSLLFKTVTFTSSVIEYTVRVSSVLFSTSTRPSIINAVCFPILCSQAISIANDAKGKITIDKASIKSLIESSNY